MLIKHQDRYIIVLMYALLLILLYGFVHAITLYQAKFIYPELKNINKNETIEI